MAHLAEILLRWLIKLFIIFYSIHKFNMTARANYSIDWLKFELSYQNPHVWWNYYLVRNVPYKSPQLSWWFLLLMRNPRLSPIQNKSWTLQYKKMYSRVFWENTNFNDPKLFMNDHWIILCRVYDFFFMWIEIPRLSLYIKPDGKMF